MVSEYKRTSQQGSWSEDRVSVEGVKPRLHGVDTVLTSMNAPAVPGCSFWKESGQNPNSQNSLPATANRNYNKTAFGVSPEQIIPVPHKGRQHVRKTNH